MDQLVLQKSARETELNFYCIASIIGKCFYSSQNCYISTCFWPLITKIMWFNYSYRWPYAYMFLPSSVRIRTVSVPKTSMHNTCWDEKMNVRLQNTQSLKKVKTLFLKCIKNLTKVSYTLSPNLTQDCIPQGSNWRFGIWATWLQLLMV